MSWKDWFDGWFTEHDDSYVVEKMARSIENHVHERSRTSLIAMCSALRDYRKQNPRQS